MLLVFFFFCCTYFPLRLLNSPVEVSFVAYLCHVSLSAGFFFMGICSCNPNTYLANFSSSTHIEVCWNSQYLDAVNTFVDLWFLGSSFSPFKSYFGELVYDSNGPLFSYRKMSWDACISFMVRVCLNGQGHWGRRNFIPIIWFKALCLRPSLVN